VLSAPGAGTDYYSDWDEIWKTGVRFPATVSLRTTHGAGTDYYSDWDEIWKTGVRFPATVSLRTTQAPPIKWVTVDERPGREADRSPSSCAEVKECLEPYLPCSIRLCDVASA
jgi:hypothetical protein